MLSEHTHNCDRARSYRVVSNSTTFYDVIQCLCYKAFVKHALSLEEVTQCRNVMNLWRQAAQSLCAMTHYDDVTMSLMASQITSLTIVYSTVYSGADQRKHQRSASLAFVWGIHRDRWNPRTKGQLRGKCFHLMTSSCWSAQQQLDAKAWDPFHKGFYEFIIEKLPKLILL